MTVAQQESAVHEVANAGKLVGGNDGRVALLRGLVHGASDGSDAAPMRSVVDEHDLTRAWRCVPSVRRQQVRGLPVLDRARVHATKTGEALEERRSAGSASPEDGDALTLVHLETGGAKHPDSRRASLDAGGVALPEGMGAKGERHDRTMRRTLGGPTSQSGALNELSAHSALRPMGPEAS